MIVFLIARVMITACRVIATDSTVESNIKKSIILLFEISVCSAMEGQLAPLAEGLGASIYPADERLLICVGVLMLSEILRQRKHLVAELTRECLLSRMDVVMALKREFCSKTLAASGELTLVHAWSNLDALGAPEGALVILVHFTILERRVVLLLLL